jgi:hypothetical protein
MNKIRDYLIKVVVARQLPSLVRHLIVALSGLMASYGVHAQDSSLASMLTACAMFLFAVIWSFLGRSKPNQQVMEMVQIMGAALARHAVTLIGAWLSVDPAAAESLQTEGVLIMVAQILMRVFAEGAKGSAALKAPPKAQLVD